MQFSLSRFVSTLLVTLTLAAGAQTPAPSAPQETRVRTPTVLGEISGNDCRVRWSRTASVGESLTIRRVLNCLNPATGARGRIVELMYEGITLFSTPEELGVTADVLASLESVAPENFAATLAAS